MMIHQLIFFIVFNPLRVCVSNEFDLSLLGCFLSSKELLKRAGGKIRPIGGSQSFSVLHIRKDKKSLLERIVDNLTVESDDVQNILFTDHSAGQTGSTVLSSIETGYYEKNLRFLCFYTMMIRNFQSVVYGLHH